MRARCELLTTDQMYRADRAAMDGGVSGVTLMENAGRAVAHTLDGRVPRGRVTVVCGPGNNGGDGFGAARHLRAMGWHVRVALLGETSKLKGDAAHHAGLWDGTVEDLSPDVLADADAVVDALFGAGLTRPLEGAPQAVVAEVNRRGLPTVAVDVPSGVRGDDGSVLGDTAVRAFATTTFFRKKPGHLLLPGAELCGEVELADIGIPEHVLDAIAPQTVANDPAVWGAHWPWRERAAHKYRYGHAVVFGGATTTGAGRLAAHAALRAGAGLVSVAAPREALPVYAAESASLITVPLEAEAAAADILADARRNALLLGPGAGVTQTTEARARALLASGRSVVLDADALTVFEGRREAIAAERAGTAVLTPHEGEFRRLFPELDGDKLTRARAAAAETGAVVVLKGSDTVIAAPDGRAAINANAPPELATGGAGDVLSGIVLGALAQGLPGFEAACAGVWLHGQAAQGFGPGLIASDLPPRLPGALQALARRQPGSLPKRHGRQAG
ncbi:NAD(P)H-hydrate epimerase [Limimonas halophila]|uniref:Bifunctional NAD(P)H-hydrate repair enzyme n=1 Tax=Limimonas halophila TaxID=1082479 RepID=A0A1G7N630_9PROT|nr:NAD(P)H-hydrate dehydratase [Limimonas halophila]SDF69412.1 NAD(P)H-hydrate epimerase [Limimonas halophila]